MKSYQQRTHPEKIMNAFQIGQKVTSSYHGVTGTVVSHGKPFMGVPSITVEYKARAIYGDGHEVVLGRKYLESDFIAA